MVRLEVTTMMTHHGRCELQVVQPIDAVFGDWLAGWLAC